MDDIKSQLNCSQLQQIPRHSYKGGGARRQRKGVQRIVQLEEEQCIWFQRRKMLQFREETNSHNQGLLAKLFLPLSLSAIIFLLNLQWKWKPWAAKKIILGLSSLNFMVVTIDWFLNDWSYVFIFNFRVIDTEIGYAYDLIRDSLCQDILFMH